MPSNRRRLATGIYADPSGISVIYSVQGEPIETRFDPGTPLERLKRWRATQIGQAADLTPRDPRGTLARDVVSFLKRLKGQPSYRSEKAHLRAWLQYFPTRIRRWQINRADVELAIAQWREHGYAARTIRHRCRLLESLYRRLDGGRVVTPLDDVVQPKKPQPRPVAVDDQVVIEAVALELQRHEILGTLRSARTRARFLVLATHTQRPAEVQRTIVKTDVDLDRRLWAVRAAKGGYHTVVPLNDEQMAAWQLFITAKAQGYYDSRSFVRTLQRCGWPKGIRPYNLRHTTGRALSAKKVGIEDIAALMGHTSPDTTRRHYVPGLIERLAAATKVIDGRFVTTAFAQALPRGTSTKGLIEDAKGRKSKADLEGLRLVANRRG